MSRNDLDIEALFRSRMEDFSLEPSPGLFDLVRSRLLWKQFLAPRFNAFNVYYLAAILALVGSGLYLLISTHEPASSASEPAPSTFSRSPGLATSPAPSVQTTPETRKNAERNVSGEPPEASGKKPGPESDQTREPAVSPPQQSVEQAPEPQDLQAMPPAEIRTPVGNLRADPPVSAQMAPSAMFTADHREGCAPLKVQFENTSVNAVQHHWTFGDGGSSTMVHPSYLFDEPGTYTVELKVRNQEGVEVSRQEMIVVHASPEARFELDEASGLHPQQPVYFYNFSKGADFYEWDFGDQTRSELMEPTHYYREPGSYDIKLKVWTTEACYDSMILYNAFAAQDNQIRFPSAFSPNPTGPTGGYYLANDIDNRVFHPVVNGDVLEYQLKIYNRKGILVFESNDLNIGWDGYYQEKLAAQGVYIYKARGRFSNGQPFVENGDLTLIHSR